MAKVFLLMHSLTFDSLFENVKSLFFKTSFQYNNLLGGHSSVMHGNVEGIKFSDKKVYCSTFLALRGSGWVSNLQKKK